jgi:hypothetical protein
MHKIELPQEHFKGKPKQVKIMLPIGLKWLAPSCTFLNKKHCQDFFLYSMPPKIVFESFYLKY